MKRLLLILILALPLTACQQDKPKQIKATDFTPAKLNHRQATEKVQAVKRQNRETREAIVRVSGSAGRAKMALDYESKAIAKLYEQLEAMKAKATPEQKPDIDAAFLQIADLKKQHDDTVAAVKDIEGDTELAKISADMTDEYVVSTELRITDMGRNIADAEKLDKQKVKDDERNVQIAVDASNKLLKEQKRVAQLAAIGGLGWLIIVGFVGYKIFLKR